MPFTYAQLKTDVANRIHNKMGRITSPRDAINDGVRNTISVPLKTLIRRFPEPIRLMDGVEDYTCPSDIQSAKVIDLRPIAENRSNRYVWRNTHPEAFDRLKNSSPVLCVSNNGQLRTLKASSISGDNQSVISGLDSTTDGGAWAVVGTASDLETDTSTYLYGSGSVRFNLGAGVKDGIDAALDSVHDITDYVSDGSIYLSASFPSITGLTGVSVRLGSDSSNYVECSVTSDISGNALISGWNVLKLKLSSGTETGTPDYSDIDYSAVLIDKDATPMTGVRLDRLIVGNGSQHILEYYSRHGWRSAAGVWKADSTLDTDILNAEEEEYRLIVESCVEQCALAAREYQDATYAATKYEMKRKEYLSANLDRSLMLTSDVWLADTVTR